MADQTTLWVATAGQILGIIRDDEALKDATKIQQNLLNIASYAAILLNLVATIAAAFLIYIVDDISESEDTIPLQNPSTYVKWVLSLCK